MTVVATPNIDKKCLLPLLLTLLFFVVSHGVGASNCPVLPKAGLGKVQGAKQHFLVVIKSQGKSSSRVTKVAPYLEVGGNVSVIDRPAFYLPLPNHESHATVSASGSTFPARAPPTAEIS